MNLLKLAGHDVVSISEIEPGASDIRMLSLARETSRILVTFDADFGDLIFQRVSFHQRLFCISECTRLIQSVPPGSSPMRCVYQLKDFSSFARVKENGVEPFQRHRKRVVSECDPLPISALQHWAYCPRQCGLIHLEQAFDDDVHTLRGHAARRQVDQPGMETRRGIRVERALPLWSERLGLIGKADVVEFEADGTPFPVEYKVGSRHKSAGIAACDDLQVAVQAACLAEMPGKSVPEGAVYYAASKRRRAVVVDASLLGRVAETAVAVQEMLRGGRLPSPTTERSRCKGCSLRERCQPEAMDRLTIQADDDLFNPVS